MTTSNTSACAHWEQEIVTPAARQAYQNDLRRLELNTPEQQLHHARSIAELDLVHRINDLPAAARQQIAQQQNALADESPLSRHIAINRLCDELSAAQHSDTASDRLAKWEQGITTPASRQAYQQDIEQLALHSAEQRLPYARTYAETDLQQRMQQLPDREQQMAQQLADKLKDQSPLSANMAVHQLCHTLEMQRSQTRQQEQPHHHSPAR